MSAASAGLMRRWPALNLPPPVAVGSAPSPGLPAIVCGAIHRVMTVSPLTLASGIFALLATTLALLTYQEGKHADAVEVAPVDETIVFRQEQRQTFSQLEQTQAFDDEERENKALPANYPRAVQTLRFVNLDTSSDLGTGHGQLLQSSRLSERRQVASSNFQYRAEGLASWYGPDFHGRLTANGERYNMNGISAANRTMPLPSYARVTNLDNGRSIIVRVNNRGPYVRRRIVDLSVGTAKALDFYKRGTAHVRVEYVGRAPAAGSDDQMLLATLREGTPAPAPANVMLAAAVGNGK